MYMTRGQTTLEEFEDNLSSVGITCRALGADAEDWNFELTTEVWKLL